MSIDILVTCFNILFVLTSIYGELTTYLHLVMSRFQNEYFISSQIDFKRECLTPNCLTDLAVVAMFTDVKNVIPVEETEQTGNNEFVFDSNRVSWCFYS